MAGFAVQLVADRKVGFLHQVIDHALKAKLAPVVWSINSSDTVVLEFFYLVWQDYAASASEDFDVSCSFLVEQVVHVFEIFVVSSLVGCHGYGIGIFLDGGIYYFFNASIVS
ncbi:hypothetical protein D9M72_408140 [compost metagenome]